MAFTLSDTIVAIATPPGRGGIGIVRLSGPDAREIGTRLLMPRRPLKPRYATMVTIAGRDVVDRALATYFPAPNSYTGDDVIEVSAHGSPVVLRGIVSEAIEHGARLAEPGEFTLRAFLNGRIDLAQAEAVGDLIDATTPRQARAAFDQLEGTLTRAIADIDGTLFDLIARLEASIDFPDEGYHFIGPGEVASAIGGLIARTEELVRAARCGRLVREGFQVAIVGRPNVGKSSLFNALVGASRAIVAGVPGTTRDLVTEVVDVEGLRVTLVDTAGLRESSDEVEIEGVTRSRQAIAVADVVIVVVDHESDALDDDVDVAMATGAREAGHLTKRLIVQNKVDLPGRRRADALLVSARTGAGVQELRTALVAALDIDLQRDRPEITNVRHAALVARARDALIRARCGVGDTPVPEEFILADLQAAREALEEVTGKRAPGALLEHIFGRFCIGK